MDPAKRVMETAIADDEMLERLLQLGFPQVVLSVEMQAVEG